MNYSREDIVKSLETIKDVCTGRCCFECVFVNDEGKCMVNKTIPSNWKINEPGEPWKALV